MTDTFPIAPGAMAGIAFKMDGTGIQIIMMQTQDAPEPCVRAAKAAFNIVRKSMLAHGLKLEDITEEYKKNDMAQVLPIKPKGAV